MRYFKFVFRGKVLFIFVKHWTVASVQYTSRKLFSRSRLLDWAINRQRVAHSCLVWLTRPRRGQQHISITSGPLMRNKGVKTVERCNTRAHHSATGVSKLWLYKYEFELHSANNSILTPFRSRSVLRLKTRLLPIFSRRLRWNFLSDVAQIKLSLILYKNK